MASTGVVFQWLDRIGLGYAIPNFSALGIVNPQDLMQIDVKTYNALGILKQDDRKRLFELVQRVRDVRASRAAPLFPPLPFPPLLLLTARANTPHPPTHPSSSPHCPGLAQD
jgi:hypothetical protein